MPLTQESILAIVFQALENLNAELDESHQVPVGVDTLLFGSNSLLDSLSLVSVIADVETAVSSALDEPICLMDDQALSQEQSPFTDVRSLCAYIVYLTNRKP